MGEIVEIELPAKILADVDESIKNGEFLTVENVSGISCMNISLETFKNHIFKFI